MAEFFIHSTVLMFFLTLNKSTFYSKCLLFKSKLAPSFYCYLYVYILIQSFNQKKKKKNNNNNNKINDDTVT